MRTATYARVSTDDQTEANQTRELDAYIAYLGEPLITVQRFTDHGISGMKTSRPGLNALLSAAKCGDIDRVVVWKLDRLGRNTEHLLSICRQLDAYGVKLVSLKESLDTSTAGGRAFLGMLAVFAQFERDCISERTKAGLARARAAGPLRTRGRKKGPVHRSTRWRRRSTHLSTGAEPNGNDLSALCLSPPEET